MAMNAIDHHNMQRTFFSMTDLHLWKHTALGVVAGVFGLVYTYQRLRYRERVYNWLVLASICSLSLTC
jgi:hypothetical protein